MNLFVGFFFFNGILSSVFSLDLSSFRSSRQFGNEKDSGVAIGLIEALQRWADALETQVSVMHGQVLTLQSQTASTDKQISDLKIQSEAQIREVSSISEDTNRLKVQNGKLSKGLSDLNNNLENFSVKTSSITEYLALNVSKLTSEFKNSETKITSLTSDSEYINKKLINHRDSLEFITNRLNLNQNDLQNMGDALNRDFALLSSNLTEKVSSQFKIFEQSINSDFFSLEDRLNDANKMIESKTETKYIVLDSKLSDLTSDLELGSRKTENFRGKVTETLSLLQSRYGELRSWASNQDSTISLHLQERNNFTQRVETAMEDFKNKISRSSSQLSFLFPSISALNSTLISTQTTIEMKIFSIENTLKNRFGVLEDKLENHDTSIRFLNDTQDKEIMAHRRTALGLEETRTLLLDASSGIRDLRNITSINRESFSSSINGTKLKISHLSSGLSRSVNHIKSVATNMAKLEEYYVDLKRKIFENKLTIVNMNVSLNQLERVDSSLSSLTGSVNNGTVQFQKSLIALERRTEELSSSIILNKNSTDILKSMSNELQENISGVSSIFETRFYESEDKFKSLQQELAYYTNQSREAEVRFGTLLNSSFLLENRVNTLETRLNRSESSLLDLKSGLNNKISKLYDIYSKSTDNVKLEITQTKNNLTSVNQNVAQVLDEFSSNIQVLKSVLYKSLESEQSLQANVVELNVESNKLRTELASIQDKIGITIRIGDTHTTRIQNLELLTKNSSARIDETGKELTSMVDILESSTSRLSDLENNSVPNEDFLKLESRIIQNSRNFSSIKINLLKLGEFVNSFNVDLGKLKTSLDFLSRKTSSDVSELKSNASVFASDIFGLRKSYADLGAKVTSLEYSEKDIEQRLSRVSEDIFQFLNTKSNLDIAIKDLESGKGGVTDTLNEIQDKLKQQETRQKGQDERLSDTKTEVATLKSTITTITSNIFSLKSQLSSAKGISDITPSFRLTQDLLPVSHNISAELKLAKEEVSELAPKFREFSGELSSIKVLINKIVAQFGNVLDPPRFSCSVTSDEIRTSGVITYSECNINTDKILSERTGHLKIKTSGDYFISFSANLVTVNSQTIWSAIYKQPKASEGWEVLGMINNYQRGVSNQDDRDSASLALITNLKEGDQIWVEWRGFGESFLYSNPYKLIHFSGFLIKRE